MATFYIPDRKHIVLLDFEPTKGKEIGKYRTALILSSKTYNKASGLVICCPISTSIRGGADRSAFTADCFGATVSRGGEFDSYVIVARTKD